MNKEGRLSLLSKALERLDNDDFREYNIGKLIKVLKDEFWEEGGEDPENKNHYWSNLKEFVEDTSNEYSISQRKEEQLNEILTEAKIILRMGIRRLS